MWTDDGRTTEASHPVSSPRAFGSGKLKFPKGHNSGNQSAEGAGGAGGLGIIRSNTVGKSE